MEILRTRQIGKWNYAVNFACLFVWVQTIHQKVDHSQVNKVLQVFWIQRDAGNNLEGLVLDILFTSLPASGFFNLCTPSKSRKSGQAPFSQQVYHVTPRFRSCRQCTKFPRCLNHSSKCQTYRCTRCSSCLHKGISKTTWFLTNSPGFAWLLLKIISKLNTFWFWAHFHCAEKVDELKVVSMVNSAFKFGLDVWRPLRYC
jgi:hypothetical protein